MKKELLQDKKRIKNIIKEWILRIDENEELNEKIQALNFGLYEPYSIDLIGSLSYDANDSDWACDEDLNIIK